MSAAVSSACVVGSALNVALISIKKLVFKPFQVNSGVRAAIDKGVKLTVFVDNENIENVTITNELKGFAAWVGYV